MRKRTSNIWKFPREQLETLVASSTTISSVLSAFGLQNKGGNYRTLRERLQHENISTKHFTPTKIDRKRFPIQEVPLSQLLVIDSKISSTKLKKKLLKHNQLNYVCALCGNTGIWNNKTLVLQLDHINGNSKDNRLINLRLLCPNCHSQTDTFAGRRFKKAPKPKRPRVNTRKVIRPTKEELEILVWKMPTSRLAKQYGVSDVAIAKWCFLYGIKKPPRGYWRTHSRVV